MSYTHKFSLASIKRAAVSVSASALFLLAALCAPFAAHAAWQPGLLGGHIIEDGNNNLKKSVMPDDMQPYLGPHVAKVRVEGTTGTPDPWWARYQTWVYVGQIYLDGSTYAFAESIDDGAYLLIDGAPVLDDGQWNATTFDTITRPAGWYSFELRLFNGINGAGPSNSDGWGTTAFGFGCNKTGATGKSNALYTYPEDAGTGTGTLFRYDDGTGFNEYLEVVGAPAGFSEADPAFGLYNNIESNQVFTASAPPAWTNAAGNVIAVTSGWKVYAEDAGGNFVVTNSGNSASFEYTHLGVQSRIVWDFAISNLISATSNPGGSVSGDGWCESTDFLTVSATPAAGYMFYEWVGDVAPEFASNDQIVLMGDRPRSVKAQFTPLVTGAIQYVTTNGNDTRLGLSPASAKLTIAAAVAELGAGGGTVIVAAGSYGVTNEIAINAPVTVRGVTGNAADVSVFRDTTANIRVFNVSHAEARLEALSVRDGRVDGISFTGGNILLSDGTVSNCVVSGGVVNGNTSLGGNIYITGVGAVVDSIVSGGIANGNNAEGGNIYIRDSGKVVDCIVRNGSSTGWDAKGGNISIGNANADALVLRCVVTNGLAQSSSGAGGGGIYMAGGRVEQCFIAYNKADGNVGSAVRMNGPGVMESCTIVRNIGDSGGAVNANNGSARVYNCVIVDNIAPNGNPANGGSVFSAGQQNRFENCVADAYINETCVTGENGFGFFDAANGNYYLTPLSVALDAGVATAGLLSDVDIDGNPRFVGASMDVGCYEYQENGIGGAFDFAFDASGIRSALVPFPVAFTAAVFNASAPVEFVWDFGDNTAPFTTSVFSVTHTYETPGSFTVSVTATDGAATLKRSYADFVYGVPRFIHVTPGVSTPAFPYDTFGNALTSINTAIDVAVDGAVIIISNGVYNITSQLGVQKQLELRSFTGVPEDVVLRGDGKTRVLLINNGAAVVRDVTIENGFSVEGANVRIESQGGMLTNSIVRNGIAQAHEATAGGVQIGGANALVTHCVITNNTLITNAGNDKGAGVSMTVGRLEHSLVADNKVARANPNNVGGLYITGASSVLNCTIAGNSGGYNGGVYTLGGTLRNTVIAGNTATQNSGDTVVWDSRNNYNDAAARFINCAADTAAPINDTCIAAPADVLISNITAGDYTPAALSPLINAGQEFAPPPATDLVGAARVQSDRIDIGCFEADPERACMSFNTNIREGFIPAQVVFTVTTEGIASSDSLLLHWDFNGDGIVDFTTNSLSVTHTYASAGIYPVSLTLENQTTMQSYSMTRANWLALAPKTLYVDLGNAAPAFPYGSWTAAANNLQTAIDTAVNGCEIIIREGEYPISTGIRVDKALRIHSDKDAPESVVLTRGDNNNLRMVTMNHSDALLSGVAIQNGLVTSGEGANLYFELRGGAVSNCVIRNGQANGHNGQNVITVQGAAALITHCVITNNTMNSSGSSNQKGIIYMGSGRIENSLIADNHSAAGGLVGIFRLLGGTIRNCTIAGNTSYMYGVVRFDNNPTAALANNVISGNTALAPETSPLWSGHASGPTRFINCTTDVYVNDTCEVELAATTYKNSAKGNYQLANGSSAIDAGDPVSPAEAAAAGIDLVGNPRIVNNRIDNGCYESRGRGTIIVIR